MPKKAGPSLLCEWMVGTTIKSALGPPPTPPKSKSKRRDVIKIHVTTDDESGEDTLTVTYPRSERLREKKEAQPTVPKTHEPQLDPESEPESEVLEVVKKVRFEKEATPKKSAMKKKTSVTFCEEEETKSDSSVDVTSTSASSGEATPEASSSNASSAAETSSAEDTSSQSSSISAKASKSTRSPKSKKITRPVQTSDSEADSDPHPTCECKECASGRKRQKQGATCEKKKCKKNDKKGSAKKKSETDSESEPETSASEAESSAEEKLTPSKKSKEKKKEKKKAEVSSTEGETSESAKETEGESEVTVKKKKNKDGEKSEKGEKNASSPNGEGKKKPDEEKEPEKEVEETKKAEEAKSEQTPPGKGKEKEVDDTTPTPKAKDTNPKLHFSDGFHYTHSRPPNLIAPIRAEVMQTERVVETQDDPPPNAYYDALHGVVRVYHGSVYGSNGHHMFAARENTAGPPHSFSSAHPMQNPYYHGYNNVMPMPLPQQQLPPHGYEHVPITQGMPIPGWNTMVPPPGYPSYNYQGLPPMSAPWYEQQLNKQGTKGAFSMHNGVGGTPDKKGKNKAREPENNVMPEVTKPNPYYTKRQSPFSNMGSNRSDSNGKPPSHSGNSNCSKNGNRETGANWDASSRRSVGAWANSSNHGAAWGDGGGDANNNNNQGGGDQWGSGGGGGDTWGTTNNNNDQWGNDNNNNTGADTWGTGAENDQNNQGGWGTTDNANNGGGTWGDGNTNDNQQANDNNYNNGGQDQGQSNPPVGGNEPNTSMIDNNVIPAAAVTGPPGEQEQSKMPGSWDSDDNGQAAFVDPTWSAYQPPPAVPAWGDPSMAADTGGAVDW